jgi:tetratricopeptide (TPR) repeat protein
MQDPASFKTSILFLRIELQAEADVSILHLTTRQEHAPSMGILEKTATVRLPAGLFDLTNRIQQRHRLFVDREEEQEARERSVASLLYQTFFPGEIGTACHDFIHLLHEQEIDELLLVIASTDEKVRNLPFEMVLPLLFGEADHLATRNFGLVRSSEPNIADFDIQGRTQAPAAPLKLLFITALPENLSERGKMLEIEDEQRKLIQAVGPLEATGDNQPRIVVEWLDNASLPEIDQALKARKHDIVHISGHGAYHEEVKRGVLYLEDEEGNERQHPGRELGEVLRYHQCVRLVLLSACETAVAGPEGTAEALAASGIPAVLAMRFSVSDEGARIFTTEFYRELSQGASLANATASARNALWQSVREKRRTAPHAQHLAEWFTPVLYQNQYLGPLVDLQRPYILPDQFYPKSKFLKSKLTRLIGEGFIGRKSYLIRLRQHFRKGQHVCIHGLGGLGKTTLAEAFADNYENHSHAVLIFRNGHQIEEKFILDELLKKFRSLQPDEYLLRHIEEALESPQLNPQEKLQLLIDNYLKGRKHILIFDNFEDVQVSDEGALQRQIARESLRDFLSYFIENAPQGCHLLFTTRYKIADFENGLLQHVQIDKLSYAEQWRYMRYSDVFRGKFSMGDFEAVYRRLDGHPRALEYLEGLVRMDPHFNWRLMDRSLDQVEERIFENLLLDRIWEGLGEELQELFTTASIFFTRSPLAALAAVTGREEAALAPGLEDLRDWSLSFYNPEELRFEVHALTREWMRKQGRPGEDALKALSKKAGDYFQDQPTWDDDLLLAREYYETAAAWEDFARISFRLQGYYQTAGFYPKAWELNRSVLEKDMDDKTDAEAMNYLGMIGIAVGDFDTALRYLEQSLAIQQQIDNRQGEGATLNNISQIYFAKGEYDVALRYLEQSLLIRQQIGDRQGEGATLNNISQIYDAKGDYDTALRYLEQSLAITQQISNRQGEGTILNNISQIYDTKGDYDTALRYLEQSLVIQQQIGDRQGEGATLNNISQVYFTKGDNDTALRYLEQSLVIRQQIGDRNGEGATLNNISQIYLAKGDYDTAFRYLQQSLAIQQQIGDRQGEGATFNNISQVYDAKGDYDTALQYLQQSLAIQQQIGDRQGEGATLNNISQVYDAKCDYDTALRYLQKSLAIQQQIGDRQGEGNTLNNISQIYDAKGDYDTALRYLQQSLTIQQQIGNINGMAATLTNMGAILFEREKIEASIPLFRQAYSIFRQIGSPNMKAPEGYLEAIIQKIGEQRFQEIISKIQNK